MFFNPNYILHQSKKKTNTYSKINEMRIREGFEMEEVEDIFRLFFVKFV